jgi:hypothetical protein
MTLGPQFQRVFHATNQPPEEFMKAPTIHVGEHAAALDRMGFMGKLRNKFESAPYDMYAIQPSEHMEVHPEKLSDPIANAADYRYLRKRGYPVTQSIDDSLPDMKKLSYKDARQVVGGARALAQNKALMYENTVEGGESLIIPAPHHNAAIVTSLTESKGTMTTDKEVQDPHTQTPLPMDYTVLQQSEVTKDHRRGRGRKL